jgi:hypothetical protein
MTAVLLAELLDGHHDEAQQKQHRIVDILIRRAQET